MNQDYFAIRDLKVNLENFEGKKRILEIDELTMQRGEAYGLIGESGTGKTVLALTILQLLERPPGEIESGEIWLDGENLLKKNAKQMMREIRGKKIAMIFQDPMSTLNPVFSVGQQLEHVLRRHRQLSKKDLQVEMLDMLRKVELPDAKEILGKYPHQLSGGQRQRIIIALALSCGAEFLIADEPTRNLDVTIQAGILKLIKNLQRDLKVSVLFIANNPGLISATCDHAAILYRGQIVEQGTTLEMMKQPAHPYTQLLLGLRVQTSEIEKLDHGQQGCIYFSHCDRRREACREEPMKIHVGGSHYVRCIRAKEEQTHD